MLTGKMNEIGFEFQEISIRQPPVHFGHASASGPPCKLESRDGCCHKLRRVTPSKSSLSGPKQHKFRGTSFADMCTCEYKVTMKIYE